MLININTGTSLNKKEIVNIINSALSGAIKKQDICIFPVLLISIQETCWKNFGKWSEEIVISFFKKIGLNGDKTTNSVKGYPLGGYPGMFRDLYYPPEWVPELRMEEIDAPLSQKRKWELRPLFYHIKELGTERAKEIYRNYTSKSFKSFYESNLLSPRLYQQILRLKMEDFSVILDLARCLTENEFEDILDALFFDRLELLPGVPDIFIFDSEYSFWFFAEVKGPNDRLRQNQKNWIRENWERIRGRFLLIEVDIITK